MSKQQQQLSKTEAREKLEALIRDRVTPELIDKLKEHFRVNEPVFNFFEPGLSAEVISLRAAFTDGRSDVIHFLEKIVSNNNHD